MKEIKFNQSPRYSGEGDGLKVTLEKVSDNFKEVSNTLSEVATTFETTGNKESAEITQLVAIYTKLAGEAPEEGLTKAELLEAIEGLTDYQLGSVTVETLNLPAVTLPETPVAGMVVRDTADGIVKCYDGTDWQPFWSAT